MAIVSVSRRTDIPCYYADWFRTRLEAGYARTYNPECGGELAIPLDPESVELFVFWSRDYRPFVRRCLPLLKDRGDRCRFQMTITGLPRTFERLVPSTDDAVSSFRDLSKKTDPSLVHWRFDPIVVTPMTPVATIVASFHGIAGKLEGYTRLCLTSFVEGERRILDRLPSPAVELPPHERRKLLMTLAEAAARHGITLRVCQKDEAVPGVAEAAPCVEGGDLHPARSGVDGEPCACLSTTDLGTYDTCPAGCLYCYANLDFDEAMERRRRHLTTELAMPAPIRLLVEQTPKLDPLLVAPRLPEICDPCLSACVYGERLEGGALHSGMPIRL